MCLHPPSARFIASFIAPQQPSSLSLPVSLLVSSPCHWCFICIYIQRPATAKKATQATQATQPGTVGRM